MFRIRFVVLTGALLLATAAVAAQDPLIVSGYDHFYNLEYEQALADFNQFEKTHPDDPEIHNNIAQALLYREMFRNGALESELVSGNNAFLRRAKLNASPATQKQFDDEVSRAISIAKGRLDKNPNDANALYTLGVTYALRSNFNFLVRKAWRDALSDATQARKMHDRVIALQPNNYDARLIPALHEYIVGGLSWTMRALGFMAGFHGDKEGGIRKLEEVAKRGETEKLDAELVLCAIYRREGKPRVALPMLNDLIRSYPRNYLFLFEKAQMYAALGNKKEALGAVEQIAKQKQAGTPGFVHISWEKIYYEMGNIQFWYNDLDQSLASLKRATAASNNLDLSSGVLAYMREGQIYDMKNQRDLARKAYQQAIAFAPESDAAKESRRYIDEPYRRSRS
jgi:tetratricopeptide (TPR) repeat protein